MIETDIINKLLELLQEAGWTVVDKLENISNQNAVLTDFSLSNNLTVDCALFLEGEIIGFIETKSESKQIYDALNRLKQISIKNFVPYIFCFSGDKIVFLDLKDKNSNPKEIKKFYSPEEIKKINKSVPYGPSNVTNNIEIFLKYLKLAIILVYVNNNSDIQEYFSSRFSEDRFYVIKNKEYGIKRILKFAYFIFSETFLLNPMKDIFNINNKSLEEIDLNAYNKALYSIDLYSNTSDFFNIPQGERIIYDSLKNKVIIKFAQDHIRDTESYAIPLYEKFKSKNDKLINFGISSDKNKYQDNNYELKQKLNSDKPTSIDFLERETDAKMLASFFADKETETPLNFALISSWGYGKSSFVNFIIKNLNKINEDIKNQTANSENYLETKIITFNAWQYNNDEQIGLALLNEMYSQINFWKKIHYSVSNIFKNINFKLIVCFIIIIIILLFILLVKKISFDSKFIADMAKLSSIILGSGGLIFFISKLYNYFGRIFGNLSLFKVSDICKDNISLKHIIKKQISEMKEILIGKNERLILIIDDLDRCNTNSIINLLDALSIYFSDNCNVLSILNIDMGIIIDAVNSKFQDKNNLKGIQYLEKIIQTNYNIFPLTAEQQVSIISKLLPIQNKNFHEQTVNSTDEKQNINTINIIEQEEPVSINTANMPADKQNNFVKLDLPDDIVSELKSFVNNNGKALKLYPRKIKRIINVLKLLIKDLKRNNIDYDSSYIVSLIFILELHPELTTEINKRIDKENEFLIKDLISENPYMENIINNIKIKKDLYKYIHKYILEMPDNL